MKDLGLRIARVKNGTQLAAPTRCGVCGAVIPAGKGDWFDMDLRAFVCPGDCADSLGVAEIYLRGVIGLSVPETPSNPPPCSSL